MVRFVLSVSVIYLQWYRSFPIWMDGIKRISAIHVQLWSGLGRSPSNSGPREKHSIRRAFHPQLRALWNEHPVLSGASTIPLLGLREETDPERGFVRATRTEWIASQHRRGAFYFTPLVTKELDLICCLDIQFFRREAPGALIQQGGDIDNRIKTLFDALRVPDEKQVEGMKPADEEVPFYCLLQDDVTGFSVQTVRLLEPVVAGERPTDVALTINVKIATTLASETDAFNRLKPA
jgi:hypothetical protein